MQAQERLHCLCGMMLVELWFQLHGKCSGVKKQRDITWGKSGGSPIIEGSAWMVQPNDFWSLHVLQRCEAMVSGSMLLPVLSLGPVSQQRHRLPDTPMGD